MAVFASKSLCYTELGMKRIMLISILFFIFLFSQNKGLHVFAFELPQMQIPKIQIPNQGMEIMPTIPPIDTSLNTVQMPSIPAMDNIAIPSIPPINMGQDMALPTIPQTKNILPTIALPQTSLPNIGGSMSNMLSGTLNSLGNSLKNTLSGLANSLLGSLISTILNPLLGLIQKLIGFLSPVLMGGIFLVGGLLLFKAARFVIGLILQVMRRR